MIRITGITLGLDEDPGLLFEKIQALLPAKAGPWSFSIERQSLDARRRAGKQELAYQYIVLVSLENPSLEPDLSRRTGFQLVEEREIYLPHGRKTWAEGERPVLVGMGPAGLFAAYILAEEGYAPLLVERGGDVDSRHLAIEGFWSGQTALDPENNVQFGEGGAGTFSDGKLTSRSKDPWGKRVLEIFAENGAPAEILYQQKPHIGTDLLREVVKSMRQKILDRGGQVFFHTKMTGLCQDRDGRVFGIETDRGNFYGPVFLGIGHSARDSFRMLVEAGVQAEPKAFAVGCRMEHPQILIDQLQYGKFAGHPRLGPASYQVHSKMDPEGRNAYSFCMCPGGEVIAAASAPGRLVVNGMSLHARQQKNANSALLTSVQPGRDYGMDFWAGIEFQEKLERAAFEMGGGDMTAPGQSVPAFLADFGYQGDSGVGDLSLEPSYRLGVREVQLRDLLPPALGRSLAKGLDEFGRYMPGFTGPAAYLTGVETRSSSPLRFIRQPDNRQAVNHPGLYPIGEGAGYAGGIVSAALDGMRSAAVLIAEYAPLEKL